VTEAWASYGAFPTENDTDHFNHFLTPTPMVDKPDF
jgi:hypothetical protein